VENYKTNTLNALRICSAYFFQLAHIKKTTKKKQQQQKWSSNFTIHRSQSTLSGWPGPLLHTITTNHGSKNTASLKILDPMKTVATYEEAHVHTFIDGKHPIQTMDVCIKIQTETQMKW